MKPMLGSAMADTMRSRSVGLYSTTRTASSSSLTSRPSKRFTVRPLSCANSRASSSATRSIRFCSSASFSVNAIASRTVFSASSALRPRFPAMLRSQAAVSFSILFRITGSICCPIRTGEAAPVFVPGAMAATSAIWSTKKPAEAARAPPGVT
jgi:hypothetical protein